MKPIFKYGRGYITDYYVRDITLDLSLQIFSVNVEVRERRIRATWTPQLAQDVRVFNNIDAMAELTALLQEQMVGMMGIPPIMLNDFRPRRSAIYVPNKFKYGK